MTDQLKEQRNELVSTNQQLDERRRFTEAMLSGVSAGVSALDPDGRISMVNRSATMLLSKNAEDLVGKTLDDGRAGLRSGARSGDRQGLGFGRGPGQCQVGEEGSQFHRPGHDRAFG